MPWTGIEIFNLSMALIGMIEEDGTISTDDTARYRVRTPYLLTIGQFDLAKTGDLYNIVEYTNNDIYDQWVKYTLPTDYERIKDALFEYDDGEQITSIMYKQFGKNEIYIYYQTKGKVRISYIPVPTKITSIEQTLQISDFSATKLAWFLAWQFKLAEQDETAIEFENEYKLLKASDEKPATYTQIIDVYP